MCFYFEGDEIILAHLRTNERYIQPENQAVETGNRYVSFFNFLRPVIFIFIVTSAVIETHVTQEELFIEVRHRKSCFAMLVCWHLS